MYKENSRINKSMDSTSAAIIAAVITIVLFLCTTYIWYTFSGWTKFSYSTGDNPSWIPSNDADISLLRFHSCTFTVNRSDGVTETLDVTPVLNSMAVAFKGGIKNPASLTLTRPLNPFSFVIMGFNDRKTVLDPSVAPWCINCPDGTKVTLTGYVRTL